VLVDRLGDKRAVRIPDRCDDPARFDDLVKEPWFRPGIGNVGEAEIADRSRIELRRPVDMDDVGRFRLSERYLMLRRKRREIDRLLLSLVFGRTGEEELGDDHRSDLCVIARG
jgi:hypothetical protein